MNIVLRGHPKSSQMSSFSMLRTQKRESKTKPTKNYILAFTLKFNSRSPRYIRTDSRSFLSPFSKGKLSAKAEDLSLELMIFEGQNWCKNKLSPKKSLQSVRLSCTFREFSRLGFAFRNYPLLVSKNMVPQSLGKWMGKLV